MLVRYSRSPRRPRAIAAVRDVRPLWWGLIVTLAVLLLATAAQAQDVRVRKVSRVRDADTTRAVVREVHISHEGIRIEREHDGTKDIVIDETGGSRITIDTDLDSDSDGVYIGSDIGGDNRVTFLEDINIGPGEVVDGEAVAIFGSVKVDGAVESQVVSIFGNVTLGDSARAGADVVAVGGSVRAAPSARIRGDQVSLPFFGLPQWQPWVPLVFSAVLLFLSLLLGVLNSILIPERLVRVAETISQRTFLSLVVGSATFPILPIVLMLLCISFIGLPVALVLLLLFPVALFVGYVAAAALLGSRLRGRPVQEPPLWMSVMLGMFLLGFIAVAAIALVTYGGGGAGQLIGFSLMAISCLMISVSTLLGTGALFLSRLGQPPRPASGTLATPASVYSPGNPPPGGTSPGLTVPQSTP